MPVRNFKNLSPKARTRPKPAVTGVDALFEAKQTRELPRGGYGYAAVSRHQLFVPGELLLQRFRIVRLIGSGGMGEVYEAEDLEVGWRVALKTIRSEITGNLQLQSRFRREVQLARRVSHPNICRIHELFVLPESAGIVAGSRRYPTLFLTMEFLPGITLAEKLQRDGPLPWREAEAAIAQICAGLEAIHSAGIVHRDLKTRNIMLVEANGSKRVLLMDFGLALEIEAAAGGDDTSWIAGTPDSMAPEQFDGRPVTAAADIYALGLVIYEMVTGKKPFAAATPIAAAALRARRPEPASSIRHNVPSGWNEVIDRCLKYDPEDRYPSASRVIAALRVRDNPVGHIGVRIAQLARRPLGWTLAAIAVIAAGLGIWYWIDHHTYHHPSDQVESWYEKGVEAIRQGTYVKATRMLQMAEDKDPHFAMAHARLAEAWSQLDFTGNADREMLEASTLEQQQHLPRLDDMYVHAVRDTLTRHYDAAVQEYRAILDALPDEEKADGYVDLGRANEKAGHIPEALTEYKTASLLAPDSPAAFVHIAILQSRLQKKSLADTAFDRAESIYRTEVNEEGLAEIAYQRGYAANDRADSVVAEKFLNESIEIAKQIPSVQMEIRALTQLSDVHSEAGDDKTAAEEANRAIQLARENGIESWSAVGLARLGATYLDATDPIELKRAEQPLQQAIRIAQVNQQTYVEAEATINLASLRDQERKPPEVIPLARKAHDLYIANGDMTGALSASILLTRAQRDQGDLAGALTSSREVLALAQTYGDLRDNMQAEDLIGTVLLKLEEYPEALEHFQRALASSRTQVETARESEHCAEVLWRLGRYVEAEKALGLATSLVKSDLQVGLIRARLLSSQSKYAAVLLVTHKMMESYPDNADEELQLISATAELHLGQLAAARKSVEAAADLAARHNDTEMKFQIQIEQAALLFAEKSFPAAKDRALQASLYFHVSGQAESELHSLYYLALSLRALGDKNGADANAQKVIDITHRWEHIWGLPFFQSYLHRPDVAAILGDLRQ